MDGGLFYGYDADWMSGRFGSDESEKTVALSPEELLTAYRATPRALRALVNGLDPASLDWRRDEG
ncbi:MAG: hypothetical protein R2849_10860 [Thermomicrobiales bacterium]